MAPFILFSYQGRYCSGLLMLETDDAEGVDTLKDIATGLTSAWIAYVVVVAIGLQCLLCINMCVTWGVVKK